MRRQKQTPLPQHENPDLDVIREIAHEMIMAWSFHEVAIDDPFKAEQQVREWGEKLVEQVGWPKGWTIYEP